MPPASTTPVGSLLPLTLLLFCRIADAPNLQILIVELRRNPASTDTTPTTVQSSSPLTRSLPSTAAQPGPSKPPKARKCQFGTDDVELPSDPDEVQPPSKKKPARKEKKLQKAHPGKINVS